MTMFKRAERKATRLRIGLESPAGGGKTWTALKIATQLADHDKGRVAVIDSERGSSAKYGEGRPFDFDIAVLDDPNPVNYIDAMQGASEAGAYPVVVIDSGSHEWRGVLRMVDQVAQTQMRGNSWSAWSKGRPAHDAFVDAILAMKTHVIVTFRSKQETAQKKVDGRTVVEKLGLAAVAADDIDYEFDVWGSIDHGTHTVIISKSRIDTIPVGSEWPHGDGLADAYLKWANGAAYEDPAPFVRQAAEPEPRREEPERARGTHVTRDSAPALQAQAARNAANRAAPAQPETPAVNATPRTPNELWALAKQRYGWEPAQVYKILGLEVDDKAGLRALVQEKSWTDVLETMRVYYTTVEAPQHASQSTLVEAALEMGAEPMPSDDELIGDAELFE